MGNVADCAYLLSDWISQPVLGVREVGVDLFVVQGWSAFDYGFAGSARMEGHECDAGRSGRKGSATHRGGEACLETPPYRAIDLLDVEITGGFEPPFLR